MGTRVISVIDVDDQETWPPVLRDWVAERASSPVIAGELAGGGLSVRLAEEDEALRSLFQDDSVLVYHCCRLLPHEIESIRERGLRPLSRELVQSRLDGAYTHGYISRAEQTHLLASSVYAFNEQQNRENKVCFMWGRAALEDTAGCHLLLSTWGGEAIYWADVDDAPRWARIGRPTVVVARINVSLPRDQCLVFPGLGQVLTEAASGRPDVAGEIHYHAAVVAEDIVDLWHPGDPEYDRYPNLPRD